MRPVRLPMVVVVLVTALCAEAPSEEWVELKSTCRMFVINPQTGAVLGIAESGNAVTLYPKAYIDGKGKTVIGPVEIAANAQDVLFKPYKDKAYFVVSFANSTQLFVLDARTLKVAAKVTAKQIVKSTIAGGTDPDDPYVYCAGGFHDGGGCVSLATMAWAGSTGVEGSDIAVSADGNYMYSRSTGVSPTGFDGFRKVVEPATGKAAWVKIFDQHTSVQTYLPGPFSRFCATGTALYSVDLRQQVAKLDFTPRCFFSTAPVIAGLSGEQLVTASYNTQKTFSTTELPAGFLGATSDSGRRPSRRRYPPGRGPRAACMADDANKRVVLGFQNRLLARTLQELKVPDEPFLVCRVRRPRGLYAGQKATFTLTPLDKRCKIALKQGPTGMALSGTELTWTPGFGQVGPAKAVLGLSAGATSVSQAIDMNVARPYVPLAFRPSGLAVSHDGSRAVVWTSGSRDPWRRDAGAQPSKIALIDLAKMQVLVSKTLPYTVRTAAVDANFVYAAPTGADRINALGLKDLTRQTFTLTDSSVRGLLPIASKRLVVNTQNHGPRVYAVPKLKQVGSPVARAIGETPYPMRVRPDYYGREGGGMPVQIGKNWYAAGCLFGPELTTAKMFVGVGGMPTLADRRRAAPAVPLPWGRMRRGSELLTRAGQKVASFGQGPTTILAGVPVAATLTVGQSRTGGYRTRSTAKSASLSLRELVSGKVVEKVPLMSGVVVPQGQRAEREGSYIAGVGAKVVALVGDRLFVHAVSEATLKQCPAPFGFQPMEEVTVLDLTKPTGIPSKTVGGTEPIEYELLGSRKEITIDPKTGVVTIDGPALTQQASALLISQMQQRPRSDPREAPAEQTPKQAVALVTRQAAARFKAYTGRAPKGIPVLVPVRVAATDKHQQVASLEYQAVLDVPQTVPLKALEVAAAQARKEREETEKRRAEAERRWREEEARRKAAYDRQRRATSQPADSEAIRRLERRIERLEAQVELIMRLLQKQSKQE